MTVFADISAALVAALAQAPAVAGGRVYRGHAWPMPEGTDTMVWVRPMTTVAEVAGIQNGPIDWRSSYEIEIRVRYTPDTVAADAAVDPLIGDVFSRVAGMTPPDGVMDVVQATTIDWDYSEADLNIVGAVFRLDVVHRTGSTLLSAF
jgi:hypothetical protein